MRTRFIWISALLLSSAFACREKPLAPRVDNVYDPLYPRGDNIPPKASFSCTSTNNITFRFDASASHESDDTPCSLCFRWDFDGDGQCETEWTTEAMARHVFEESGAHKVHLEVKGVKGLVGQGEAVVTASIPAYLRDMALVPAGSFQMGSESVRNTTHPALPHVVTLDAFWMGKYEVTNEQYAAFLNDYGKDVDDADHQLIFERQWGVRKTGDRWEPQPSYDHFPVVGVTWYGAARYAEWQGTRLPTEAEWEYAAHGANDPDSKLYSSRSPVTLDYTQYAWFSFNTGGRTHLVGERLPNRLGLYDMSGNVWEWCNDWYGAYPSESVTSPQGPASGTYRVRRGGGYLDDSIYIFERYYSLPNQYGNDLGFRVVRSIE